MIVETTLQLSPKDRIRGEQANAWIARWQAGAAPNVLFAALTGRSLSVHAAPNGACMFVLDWSDESVLLAEAQGTAAPYRFNDVKSALVFLDALLLHYVVRRDETERPASALSSQLIAQPG